MKFLGLRKVYTIAFACDQTVEYYGGGTEEKEFFRLLTHLGKEAWRTTDVGELVATWKLLDDKGLNPMACNAVWEFHLNREDWTW